jgi:uncharacterized membrane protein YdjX (TVP38/TMEM64 family)
VEERGMNKRGAIYRLMLVAALVAAIGYFVFHRDIIDASSLEHGLRRFGQFAPIIFVLVYALGTVLFLPGSVLTIAGGAMFGPVWGTLWNLIGATLGATLAFMIARYLASDWVAKRAGEGLGRLMRGVEEEGWRFVALVRLVPLFPFNLVNYAFGLTRIALAQYVVASFVCMAPGAFAYTYVGYAGWQAASGHAGSIHAALLALGLVAAVAFLPRLVRRLKGSRFTDAATLKRRLEAGEKFVLIDVRGADEFTGPLGHIEGASNVPLAELSASITQLTGMKSEPVITI